MKTTYAIALAVLSAVGGAVAIQTLHAQSSSPVYLVTEIDVTNPQAYGTEFAPKAQATIKAAGGKFIAIGGAAGAGAKQVIALDGQAPKRVTIQQWDSTDTLMKWYKSADYQAALEIGKKYANFRRYIVEGQ
jgi:uncharacterized protein (DUF1330 family)